MDMEELRRRYGTRDEDLTPEQRERAKRMLAHTAQLRAEGYVATEPHARTSEPFGMDKNFRPYPVRDTAQEEPRDTDETQQ